MENILDSNDQIENKRNFILEFLIALTVANGLYIYKLVPLLQRLANSHTSDEFIAIPMLLSIIILGFSLWKFKKNRSLFYCLLLALLNIVCWFIHMSNLQCVQCSLVWKYNKLYTFLFCYCWKLHFPKTNYPIPIY